MARPIVLLGGWALLDLASSEHDEGTAEVVASVDVTGDGIPEHLLEFVSRRGSPTDEQSGTERAGVPHPDAVGPRAHPHPGYDRGGLGVVLPAWWMRPSA